MLREHIQPMEVGMIQFMVFVTFFLLVLPAPAQQEPAPVSPETLKDFRFETTAEFRRPFLTQAQAPSETVSLLENVIRAVEKARAEFGQILKLSADLDALAKQEQRDEARERQLEHDLLGSLKGFLQGTVPGIREEIGSGDLRGSIVVLGPPQERLADLAQRRDIQTLNVAAGRARFEFPRAISRLEEALMTLLAIVGQDFSFYHAI